MYVGIINIKFILNMIFYNENSLYLRCTDENDRTFALGFMNFIGRALGKFKKIVTRSCDSQKVSVNDQKIPESQHRSTHSDFTLKKSHRTLAVTRHQGNNSSKATSDLFLSKMIVKNVV